MLFLVPGQLHGRHGSLHVNVTAHPTPGSKARQWIGAFPGDGWIPRFLIHDRDSNCSDPVKGCCKMLGVSEILTAYRSPWQNAFVERQTGSIRRGCLDPMIVLGEGHCLRLLVAYARYFNEVRPHPSLNRNSPAPR